ncbi:MAG: hypothetical protein SGCHY_002720, partial [Lobulomycetales sp.]
MMERLTVDVNQVRHVLKATLTQGVKSVVQVAGSIIYLSGISPLLTGILGGTSLVVVSGLSFYGRVIRELSQSAKSLENKASSVASRGLAQIRTIRAFSRHDHESNIYSGALLDASAKSGSFAFHLGIYQGLVNFGSFRRVAFSQPGIGGMTLGILYIGGTLVNQGFLTPGNLMSFLVMKFLSVLISCHQVASQNGQKALSNLANLSSKLQRASSSLTRLVAYTSSCIHQSIPLTGGVALKDFTGRVEFHNVKFSYPSRPDAPVLSQFNLQIPRGGVAAIAGASGSGKSTVADLLLRLYDPSDGVILFDGVPLQFLDPSWVRAQIGIVSGRHGDLIGESVEDGIRYGKLDATTEEIRQAARLANADGFIQDFPQGYKTPIGDQGVALSGGQRQRILIARALLRKPSILIMDEATSALDATSESEVQAALEKVSQDKT